MSKNLIKNLIKNLNKNLNTDLNKKLKIRIKAGKEKGRRGHGASTRRRRKPYSADSNRCKMIIKLLFKIPFNY